ncbi:hypothetical protein SAMN05216374_2791 [Tardiphaga sp. OK246]|uniref:hypothetical protein n=1 Tax=Tardiphaga sp. OK246 TaxID=1855307 RepID=UPI000B6C377F|nr:hypothetical protein [Tardiphaga sp. OK246]SNT12314.1 hypothetical protein SAMN05216374_2791 [Tardiphaga sp. OK246]
MDWSVIVLLALVGVFFLWRSSKNEDKAKVASATLESDTRLYQRIKTGMREYNFREHEGQFWKAKNGDLLFDTAHLSAFHVDHFAEIRVGFYFKDLNEYGLYGGFAGDGEEFHDSYYRTDRTFQKEQVLMTNED